MKKLYHYTTLPVNCQAFLGGSHTNFVICEPGAKGLLVRGTPIPEKVIFQQKKTPARGAGVQRNQLFWKFKLLMTLPSSVMTDSTQPAQKVLLFQLQAASSRVTS